MSDIPELDWEEAEQHLKETREAYVELLSMPNVNPFFGLAVIKSKEDRFNKGERTKELYEEIMALK